MLPTAVSNTFWGSQSIDEVFEVLVSKASAILFPVLRLVGDSGRYNIILKVTQCPRLLGTNQWPHTKPLEFSPAPFPSHSQVARSLSCHKPRASMTKKGPFFGPHNLRKSRRAKRGLPSSRFQSQLLLVKSASTWNKRFNRFATMKGPKLDSPGGTTFDFKGSTFWPPFKYVSFARGSKTGPSTGWIWCLLGGPVLSPPQAPSSAALFQCRSASASHKNTALAIRASNKGGPNSVSKNHISFRCQKRTQKLVPCTCLSRSWQSFPFCYVMKEVPFPKPAIEALRGSARPGRGHASDATRIGTRTKRGSRGLETI